MKPNQFETPHRHKSREAAGYRRALSDKEREELERETQLIKEHPELIPQLFQVIGTMDIEPPKARH